ncbi:hypothetical protein SeMB42_g05700 [Synchytrium endobioticum]|uniref:Uncharacterized protein n=1 Tax=Synchytrium endobioticum TaxID=286115 RepID=A0A507CPV9_9FUNG|nr:hypothetical protein SeMB42_g05700 [Synchytrium endobioticum]
MNVTPYLHRPYEYSGMTNTSLLHKYHILPSCYFLEQLCYNIHLLWAIYIFHKLYYPVSPLLVESFDLA